MLSQEEAFNSTENGRDMFIMCADKEVLRVNVNSNVYGVINETLMPYQLKGRIRPVKEWSPSFTKYDVTQNEIAYRNNYNAILAFLSGRVLPLSRSNAKWIYNLFKFPQLETQENKARIALVCRAVTLQDNYWVKIEGDDVTWDEINIRHNSLNNVVTQVALLGKGLTLQGSMVTPELTTHGAYAKGWVREDGELWLYKLGSKDPTESKIEVMTSNLLDKCNVEHWKYERAEVDGVVACKCKCMTTDKVSMLHGMDYISYCNVSGKDPETEMFNIDGESLYKMWIVDYLISNRDRHGMNWGFFYDADSTDVIKCFPLYDHNNAFDNDYMEDGDLPYLFGEQTMRQAAHRAMKHVDFHFTAPIERSDFMTTKQYNSFMSRAKELGIKTVISNEVDNALERLKNV